MSSISLSERTPSFCLNHQPVFKEIVRMRDEAHRFAITSHKKMEEARRPHLRARADQGRGKKEAESPAHRFPSTEAIKEAGVEEIARLPGFTKGVAEEIIRSLLGEAGDFS